MSGLSSLFSSRLLASMHRPSDPLSRSDHLSRLRFALETMPGSRKYVFTPATRTETLGELYDALWGQHAQMFLPGSLSSLPPLATLSEVQANAGMLKDLAPVPGRPCGHIFKKGESCFRCKDCALDDSCVLCSKCFEATDHADHNVSFFIAQQSGGCCDCGDAEAWRTNMGCPYHPPSEEAVAHIASFIENTLATPPRTVPRIVTAADVSPVANYPHRVSIPPELRETMGKTVAYALDFVLDTLDFSPDETSAPREETDLRAQPTGDPLSREQYCVVIWSDDKHSFEELTQLLVDLTGRSPEEAAQMVEQIDENGREAIDMNATVPRLLEIALTISQIDLGVTVRRAYDTFREQVAAVIIEWLVDLTRSRVGTDGLVMREVIAAELLAPRRNYSVQIQEINKVLADVQEPARLDWLFLYHHKLWKKPRLNLKEIYASILTISHDYKIAVASHFANVYHRIIDTYLLIDREAETSIKYFALQLFTVPSIGLYIVRQHNVIARLLAIITAFFTNQIHDKRVVFPPEAGAAIDVETFPFKSKRFMPVFSDLRYLCHNAPVQALLAHAREHIAQFCKTCQIFMCVNPNKRAVTSHVEYETDAWISMFNVTLSLSRVIKVYGEAFAGASAAELVAAITTVMHHILIDSAVMDDTRDVTRFPPVVFHEPIFGNTAYQVVNFEVMEGWVSFHHSLQWLLAELFKHTDLLSAEALQAVGMSSLRDVCLRNASEQAVLTIIDYPLRVLAKVAQIRTGLWVRNGFAIRGQLMHYRDFMLRELCFDQDLFIMQCALVVVDPNTVMVSMLDRFQLLDFFAGTTVHAAYDASHLFSMAEEFLYILITMLTERANATKMPLQLAIKREIIHALAVGPCTFTELTKRVTERMVDDVSFERVLRDVATCRVPESSVDTGTYELNDEFFDEVNPFFFHYTRNKREDVETILHSRLKRRGENDPVIVPKPLPIPSGPFASVPLSLKSEVLLQILFYGIHNVLAVTEAAGAAPASAEAILDQAVYLIMTAVLEQPEEFSGMATHVPFFEDQTLVQKVFKLGRSDSYKAYKARANWILDRFAEHKPEEVNQLRSTADGTSTEAVDSAEAKKKAAKARQEAIMRQMKAQQASFAVNFENEDDEDDEDMVEMPSEPVSHGTCIVCQEELNALKAFGSLGFLQPSRLLRRHPDGRTEHMNEAISGSPSLDRAPPTLSSTFPPPAAGLRDAKLNQASNFDAFPSQYTRFGIHASSCGHMMHVDCFNVYCASIRQRHRAQATRNHPENVQRKEWLCPLCKSLGNALIPVETGVEAIELSAVPFPDWIRAAGISILKSKPDTVLDSLQFRNGTGEFVFWSAQDLNFQQFIRMLIDFPGRPHEDAYKMVESVVGFARGISQQTRHLRDRVEPDPGERGAGLYLPEELVGYTIATMEVAQRGAGSAGTTVADTLSEAQSRTIRGLLACLTRVVASYFQDRPDGGKDAVRQAIIKRLLPEWSRTSLTSFAYPLLLRDPFTILVETAAVAPDMLRHVLVLTYYAALARTVIGLIYVLNKTRSLHVSPVAQRSYVDLFGDVRMFFMSVVRHSPVFEQAAEMAFQSFGEARIEKLLYAFTLPFLRRAAILCRAVLPQAFPSPPVDEDVCEYRRLLQMLGIPPLSDLPKQDTLQNALSGWCSHYGHSHAASQLNCGVILDYPIIYRLAKLPLVLDHLYPDQDKLLTCQRCKTVPVDAAICLICGTVCCMQSHCCVDLENGSRGECNMHTRECAGPIGLYFLVKRCSLLYLFANNGTFGQSPYLDVHGEVDISMRRGRRQFLQHARWEEVRRVWLNHGIPTLIARKLESTVDSGGWETL